MQYHGRLTFALFLSFLLHLGVVAYMSQKPLGAFGVRDDEDRVKFMNVRMVPDDPVWTESTAVDMDRLIRERQLQRALAQKAEEPFQRVPEPEANWEEPESPDLQPPVEDLAVLPEEAGSSPQTPDPLERELLHIPVQRVEAPNPESRVWIPEPSKDLPPLPLVSVSKSLPPPAPVEKSESETRSSRELPEVNVPELLPPVSPGDFRLPEASLLTMPREVRPETPPLPPEREEVVNWDDFLEVAVEAYRPEEGLGYFRATIRPNEKAGELRSMFKDVLFAVDASGSIEKEVFDQLKVAVADALSLLRDGDRFNIIGFKADVVALNPGLWPVKPETIKQACDFVLSLQPSGKTDIYRSLSSVARSLPPGDRPFLIVLFSDGRPTVGVKDSRELISRVSAENGLRAGIHVMGVGAEANRYLLELLAYLNKGSVRIVKSGENLPQECAAFLKELDQPILMNVTSDIAGDLGRESYPRILPDLFRGGSIRIYGRYDREKDLVLRLAGDVRGRKKDFVFRANLSEVETDDADIANEWATAKCYDLAAENCSQGDSLERTREIRELAASFGLQFP